MTVQPVFGQKSIVREELPSMFKLLQWEEQEAKVAKQGKEYNSMYTLEQQKKQLVIQGQTTYNENLDRIKPQNQSELIKQLANNYCGDRQIGFQKYHHEKERSPNKANNQSEVLSQLIKQYEEDSEEEVPKKAKKQFKQESKAQQKEQLNIITWKSKSQEKKIQQQLEKTQQEQLKQQISSKYYNPENSDAESEPEEKKEIKDEKEEKLASPPAEKSFKSKYQPQAKKLDPVTQKERLKRRNERIKHFNQNTRWLPNTAFQTYFGKPAFENYGNGNTKPTVGGMLSGNYLLSHNVNPHREHNHPKFIQSYNNAIHCASKVVQLQPPRQCKQEYVLSQNQVEQLKQRSQIYPAENPINKECQAVDVKDFTNQSRAKSDQKSGQKSVFKYDVPDLVNTLRFASNESSPVNINKDNKENAKVTQFQVGKKSKQVVKQQENPYEKVEKRESDYDFIKEKQKKDTKNENITQKVTQQIQTYTNQEIYQTLNELQRNPKNYKNIDPRWVTIPSAGKVVQYGSNVAQTLQQNPEYMPQTIWPLVQKLQVKLQNQGADKAFSYIQQIFLNSRGERQALSFQKYTELNDQICLGFNQQEDKVLYQYFTRNGNQQVQLNEFINDILYQNTEENFVQLIQSKFSKFEENSLSSILNHYKESASTKQVIPLKTFKKLFKKFKYIYSRHYNERFYQEAVDFYSQPVEGKLQYIQNTTKR